MKSDLQKNIEVILSEIKSSKAKLLIVSKNQTLDDIRSLYDLGFRDFGENKVQELLEKSQKLQDLKELRWHFIGHLQTNKINKLAEVKNLVSIHSVDSIELFKKLVVSFKNHAQKLGLFLQFNTSGEVEKFGFDPEEDLSPIILAIDLTQQVYVQGLMTMGTYRTDHPLEEARKCFQKLKDIRQELSQKTKLSLELSMGMSGDYVLAAQMESDWVRVGSKIFTVPEDR